MTEVDSLIEKLYTSLTCPEGIAMSGSIFEKFMIEALKRPYNSNNLYVDIAEKGPEYKFHGLKVVADSSIPNGEIRSLFPDELGEKNVRLINVA